MNEDELDDCVSWGGEPLERGLFFIPPLVLLKAKLFFEENNIPAGVIVELPSQPQ